MSVDFNTDNVPDDGGVLEEQFAATDYKAQVIKPSSHKKTIMHRGVEKILTTIPDLNKRFALLDVVGQGLAFVNRTTKAFMTTDELNKKLANEVVQGKRVDEHEKAIIIPAAEAFRSNKDRHSYTEMAFTVKPVEDHVFNQYRGLGIKPVQGDCSLLIKHIEHVLCNGDKNKAADLIKLLAWQIQHVGEPSRVIVVFYSEHMQLGKGVLLEFVMQPIYGPSYIKPSNLEHQVVGRFNTVLLGASFVFLDEVMYGGNHQAASTIKSHSTALTMSIEPKGLPTIQTPIGLNFFLATNKEDGVQIDRHDKRYWVFDVREERMPKAYFDALINEIKNGGREAFAYLLMNMDLGKFQPWDDINMENAAKDKFINAATNPFDMEKWLAECYFAGQILGMQSDKRYGIRSDDYKIWKEGEEVSPMDLYAAYKEWMKNVRGPTRAKPTAPNTFWSTLTKVGFVKTERSNTSRKRVMPPISRLAGLAGDSGNASGGVSLTVTKQVTDLSATFGLEIVCDGE